MAWLAVNKAGIEQIFELKPIRWGNYGWVPVWRTNSVSIPKGTIAKLIGRELTWEDEPYELK